MDNRRVESAPTNAQLPPRRLTVLIGAALLFLGAVLAGGVFYELHRPLVAVGRTLQLRATVGSSARGIAVQLRAAGLAMYEWEFLAAAALTRATRTLRPGRYRFEAGTNLWQLLAKLRRGAVERETLLLVDGARFADLRGLIDAAVDLRHDTAGWSEQQLLQALGASSDHAEGWFAPDTYVFDPGSSDLELYRRAYRAQCQRLERAWQVRRPDLAYAQPYQALIMASIIERETGQAEERPLVAAVLLNRLRLGMPLQSDPVVIYGLGSDYSGRLHKASLQRDTLYNTYIRIGLPPTPIALPGKAAIEAALHPLSSRALYFVARGDGTSEFSLTLADHNRAVERYQRGLNR